MSERAWLVEWRFNGVQWLYLWPSTPGGFSFTSDASKALRFARREDAEAALQWARDTDAARRPIGSLTRHGLALGEMLVTEHDWPALTAAPSAQAEPDDEPRVTAGGGFPGDHNGEKAAQAEPLRPIPGSALVAARRTLEGKSGVDFLEGWVEFVAALAAAPTAQAEPQVPLTDEQIDKLPFPLHEPDQGGVTVTEALRMFARAIERAHGIGKQESK